MRVMSWNVNKPANSEGRIDKQLNFIDSCEVDVLLLQELRYGTNEKWLDVWQRELDNRGLGTIAHSCDWAAELSSSQVPPHSNISHNNGHLTAVNTEWELTRRGQTIRDHIADQDWAYFDTNFPEKILVSTLETDGQEIDLWNVRAVPGNGWGEEKIKIFETVYNRLSEEGRKTRILAGDFNSPDAELSDGQAIPFGYDKDPAIRDRWVEAELKILKGLGHLGMLDVFRHLRGYGEIEPKNTVCGDEETNDTSWRSKRFDHIFATDDLTSKACCYHQGGLNHSDHVPIIADFDLSV